MRLERKKKMHYLFGGPEWTETTQISWLLWNPYKGLWVPDSEGLEFPLTDTNLAISGLNRLNQKCSFGVGVHQREGFQVGF